jgi:hypothetical protein
LVQQQLGRTGDQLKVARGGAKSSLQARRPPHNKICGTVTLDARRRHAEKPASVNDADLDEAAASH